MSNQRPSERSLTGWLALLVAVTAFLVPVGASSAAAAPDHYRPKPGILFNSAVGDHPKRRVIFNAIMRSINSSPRGSAIKMLTWNYLTSEGTDALLAAQRRGVTVRVLMDAGNNSDEIGGNPPFRRLRSQLHRWNDAHPKHAKSWAKTCERSCRGSGGVAHSKFFMFSRVGKVKRVVMQGSANFTLASTNNQWNDAVVHTRGKPVWRFYNDIFQQARKDKPVKRAFVGKSFGGFSLYQYPMGREKNDPVMRLLDKVKCKNAGTASGRTVIQMAPDVIRQSRGMRLARKIRGLWNAGCNIRIGYTVVGIDVGRYLRDPSGRGPVPMKHLVQDFDGDGQFDNYFHLKAMSIVGNVGGDRMNHVVLNGSANLSNLAAGSDENVGIYWDKGMTLRYQDHLNYWYDNFPVDTVPTLTTMRRGVVSSTSGDHGILLGSGANAVYEDGTPYSTTGVNPFSKAGTN